MGVLKGSLLVGGPFQGVPDDVGTKSTAIVRTSPWHPKPPPIPSYSQTQVAQLLVQPLEAASVVLGSGVRIFDTGPLRIPKLTAGASVVSIPARRLCSAMP
jgi:hypothetical protein